MTERTGGVRPDYAVLHRTGEVVLKREVKNQGVDSSEAEDLRTLGASSGEGAGSDSTVKSSTPKDPATGADFFNFNYQGEVENYHQRFSEYRTPPSLPSSESEESQYSSDDTLVTVVAAMEEDDKTLKTLLVHEASLVDDINDFIDEYEVQDMRNSISDLDAAIRRIEDLRSAYRMKHKELKSHVGDEKYDEYAYGFEKMMEAMKYYIHEAKEARKGLRKNEEKVKLHQDEARQQKVNFVYRDTRRSMKSLKELFSMDVKKIKDEDIIQQKKDLPNNLKELQTVARCVQDIIDAGINKDETRRLQEEYETLVKLRDAYSGEIDNQLSSRQIEKKKSFQKTLANIKIPIFKGYESSIDVYTFQDEFEKLYLDDAPTDRLPDILKNTYLENPAKLLVKDVKGIDEIWTRLKEAYGDHHILLSRKLAEVGKIDATWKSRDPEKKVEFLSKITNLMKDLMQLAKRHKIENKLYYGDALDNIYRLMGDTRLTKWLSVAPEAEGEELWENLILFLEKDLQICQKMAVILTKSPSGTKDQQKSRTNKSQVHVVGNNQSDEGLNREQVREPPKIKCVICDKDDHVQTRGPRGLKLVQYFVCRKFIEMEPSERFQFLRNKGYCVQCLFPGADQEKGKHKDGRCQRDYICKNGTHERFPNKKHILVCEEHKEDEENKETLKKFKERFITHQRQLPDFARNLQLSHHCQSPARNMVQDDVTATSYGAEGSTAERSDDSAIYMLQTTKIDEHFYSIFYDNGCGDFVCRQNAVQRLGERAKQDIPGPLTISGVGDISTISPYGTYNVSLPLGNGQTASLTGLCMDRITQTFPIYPLQGAVEEDIRTAYKQAGGNLRQLPLLPAFTGGDTDLMIGIKYLRYFPDLIFKMPSGLSIYKSQFPNIDGSYGIIGGPHKIFTEIEQRHHLCSTSFFTDQRRLFQFGYQVNPDIRLLGYKETTECIDCQAEVFVARQKRFNQAEEAGSEISFRCVRCRACQECKHHEHIEATSIKEEVEQELVDRSVTVDTAEHVTTASLPFIADPLIKLAPNYGKVLKVYKQQLKKLKDKPEDKKMVIEAEALLQKMGFVEFVKNLPEDVQKFLKEHPIQNYIAWRIVWKILSMTFPARPVFDASQPTPSGYSLNDILAKGKNGLNKLVEIFIRWRCHHIGLHNDVQKMYNTIKLLPSYWCYQRYLWQDDLNPEKPPEQKIIKTLIYGVKSSGNQAERALRQTAFLSKDEFPEIYESLSKDVYVDDLLSGSETVEKAAQLCDDVETVLNRGGFTLKGFTISGKAPQENLTSDGESITVAGHKWFPEQDQISLNIKTLNFAKKKRGRKTEIVERALSEVTRRECVSKVSEIFDMSGVVTPIIASMKLDLHELVRRKLDWDDVIPNDLQQIWNSHFEMIKELKDLRFNRAVVPIDAVDLNAETLDFGDASQSLVCVAIYVRFRRRNGEFSCQLIFSRSRLVPEGMSQPRAELYAALINAHAGQVVRRALYRTHQKSIKFTDSQIVLHWICNLEKSLELWVRNRIVEIQRFTDIATWRYVRSQDMIADIGTRPGASIDTVKPGSSWMTGFDWMRGDETQFPMFTSKDLSKDKVCLKKKTDADIFFGKTPEKLDPDMKKVQERYQFSHYIFDPNRHRYKTTIRIIALVFMFIQKVRRRIKKKKDNVIMTIPSDLTIPSNLTIPDSHIKESEQYLFRVATKEVKKFSRKAQYEKISKESDGILINTSRILPSDNVTIVGRATSVMKDLTSSSFNVPLVDRYSPIAYSIVNEIHWHHKTAMHCGWETTWRYVLQIAYILEGTSIVQKIHKSCERCNYLNKKTMEVSMGALSRHNLTIAPSFYVSQVDLAGPFQAFSPHQKRATIKIWLTVFCCATTSATSIKVMDDYSTPAFIQAFTRFACEVGFPKTLLVDDGSQIVSGCENMRLKFTDIKFQLHSDVAVDFEVCPVGGHNFNGKVERKIFEIKKSLSKTLMNKRLSLLQWETLSSVIANSVNNMPLALGSVKSNLEFMDLLTPNRLRLGRNNERSPEGEVVISDYHQLIQDNQAIFDSWFEVWLTSHVPKLMYQPKWHKSDKGLKVGDVVLFLKKESKCGSNYQYGMVMSVDPGRDGKIRKVKVKYRNHNETVDRETYRAVRTLVVIKRVDELSIMEELGEVARFVENQRASQN